MATDAAMEAVETGDLDTLTDLAMAAPELNQADFAAPYLAAFYRALTGAEGDEPADLMAEAARQGTDTQRRAGAARLRRLARRRPDLSAELDRLAAILTDS
jgi:hypothetical protein